MADTKKTILAVIGAICLIVIIFVVAAVGGLAYFVRSHVHAEQTSSETAGEEFARVRSHFAGQTPMIELRRPAEASDEDEDDRFVLHRPDPSAPSTDLRALRAIVYDRRQERLLHLSIPFWILRLAPSTRDLHFFSNDTDIDMSRAHLSVSDLERHGPGVILDAKDRHGSNVLVWVE
jgi:hypothetical protein